MSSKYEEDTQKEIYETLVVLNKEEIEPFLKQFCKIEFEVAVDSESPRGNGIKFIYKDDTYIIYAINGACLYDEVGFLYNYGPRVAWDNSSEKAFYALMSQYAELRDDYFFPQILESFND